MCSPLFSLNIPFFLVACSPVSYEDKQSLEEPVGCSAAQSDMDTLAAERASVAKQIGTGASSVISVGAVVRLLRGQSVVEAEVRIDTNNKVRQGMKEINRVSLPEGFEE